MGKRLVILTAEQMLQARAEARELTHDQDETALCVNACVVARSLCRGRRRVYKSGRAILRHLSAEEIAGLAAAYADRCRRENPALLPGGWEAWKQAVAERPYERLKWQILRRFGVLPTEERARQLTDGDYWYLAVQTALDLEPQQAGTVNPAFDESRFEELRGT